ncbi:MAG: hypothetical protein HQ521_08945 [Bacteroidetes bacterium]|nr:hypothetical protein [Bacteroidota bacterium]
MALTFFKTPRPKSFKFKPRYYDQKKDEFEKRRAVLGIENELSHNEELRHRMSSRWGKNDMEGEKSTLSKVVTYLIYIAFIGLTVYFILFTDIIEKMLTAFGVTN